MVLEGHVVVVAGPEGAKDHEEQVRDGIGQAIAAARGLDRLENLNGGVSNAKALGMW